MNQHIFIVNGMARCGKDTFAILLNEIVPTHKISSIDRIKIIADACGWDGEKDEKGRKLLADLKKITTEYNDLSFECIKSAVRMFWLDKKYQILLIDIREPEEIERAKKQFGAKTVLIKNDRVPFIASNTADSRVFDYSYDYIIENNGTIEQFMDSVKTFVSLFIKENEVI